MVNVAFELGNQVQEELEYSKNIDSIQYDSLLITGMGGSGISGDVLSLLSNEVSTKSIIVRKSYSIPKKIKETNPFCLFISYSGNTEETLSGLQDAIENNLDWAVISSGGKLIDHAIEHNKEYIKIPDGLQPRAAFGYLTQAVCKMVDVVEGTNYLKDLRNGDRNFSDPLMKDAIDAYANLVASGWTNSTALSLNYSELQQTFLNGEGAMYPMGSFFAGAVPLDHPFEIGVFPMPALDGSPRLVTYTSGGPAVSALTEHPEEARKFAVEFSTNVKTNADDLFRDAHIPNNKNFDLERDMKGYELHPLIFEIIEILQTPGLKHVPFFTFEVGDYALLPGMQSEVFANSQEILSGTSTAEIIDNLNSKLLELQ